MIGPALPPIVSRGQWQQARAELLDAEMALTRAKDTVGGARRRLPMVEIVAPSIFDTETGPVSLLDLFEGRRQLIGQHVMFGADWDEGCAGCSMMTDHIGPLSPLHAEDTSSAAVRVDPPARRLLTATGYVDVAC